MRISDWSSDVCSSDLIEIGKGFGEAEQLAIVVPVTVPAHVPAFDQNAAETVLRGKIDIALRFFGRGAVDAVMAPASLDRKSVVSGQSVSVRVDLGGRRVIKKKNRITMQLNTSR